MRNTRQTKNVALQDINGVTKTQKTAKKDKRKGGKENDAEELKWQSKRSRQSNTPVIETQMLQDKIQLQKLRHKQAMQEGEKTRSLAKVKVSVPKEASETEEDNQSVEARMTVPEPGLDLEDSETMDGDVVMDDSEEGSTSEGSSELDNSATRNRLVNKVSRNNGPEFTVEDPIVSDRHKSRPTGMPVLLSKSTTIPPVPRPTVSSPEKSVDSSDSESDLNQDAVGVESELELMDGNGNTTKKTEVKGYVAEKHRKRGTLADFKDPNVNKAAKQASAEYMVRICTICAFPDDEEEEFFARECWDNACDHEGIVHPFTDHIRSLITRNASTIRGRVKDVAVASVASYFRFRRSMQPEIIQLNKELAAELLKDDGFAYEDREKGTGLYENEIIQDIILVQWFKNKKSHGIKFGPSFNPVSIPTLALVLTAIEYAIDQWSSGTCKRIADFSEAQVSEIYSRHLEAINAWKDFSIPSAQALARRQQDLYRLGRSNAGFPIPEPVDTASTSTRRSYQSKFERAAKALEERSYD